MEGRRSAPVGGSWHIVIHIRGRGIRWPPTSKASQPHLIDTGCLLEEKKWRKAPKKQATRRPIRSKIGNDDHGFRPTVGQSYTSHGSMRVGTIVLCRQLAARRRGFDAWRRRTEIPQPCSRDLILDSCLSLYHVLRMSVSRALT